MSFCSGWRTRAVWGARRRRRASTPTTTRASATGLWDGLAARFPVSPTTQPDLHEVQNRLLFAQVLEAVRAFEDGVLTDIREGDVGAILGWGFAPWSGGPFGWLDMVGAAWAAERTADLAARHGDRFATPALLTEMAEAGDTFYARYGGGQAAKAAA